MSEKNKDPEIEALEALHSALKPLKQDVRIRVIQSVFALLGINETQLQIGAGYIQTDTSDQPPSKQTDAGNTRNTQNRPTSIIEVMQDKTPKSNIQKILVFAYYREKHEGKPRFSRQDLLPYFGKAREKPPANYDRDFLNVVEAGLIHEDGNESYITSKGIEAVEVGFDRKRSSSKEKKDSKKTNRAPNVKRK